MERDPGFEDHALAAEFVEFGLECHVAEGLLDEPAAHLLEALAELPGDASYDLFAVIGEDAQGGDYSGRRHAAEKTVALD